MHYLQEELYQCIREESDLFDFIQNAALDGMWYWDLEHPENEWMNPKFWTTLGYDPNEMPHKAAAWQDIILPEDLKLALYNAEQHFQDPTHPYDLVVRYRHKEGQIVWIRCRGKAIRDEQGKAIRMLGAHTDITEHKRKEELLVRCNQEAQIGFWELNTKTNALYWSKVVRDIHGVDDQYEPNLEEAINFYEEGESRKRITEAVNKAIKTGIGQTEELRIIDKKGTLKWVKAISIADVHLGEVHRLYGTFQDITERKQLLLQMQDQNFRLKSFAQIVSHNLRTHSGNIKLLLQLLSEEHPEFFTSDTLLHVMKASHNLESTVEELTEISKVQYTDVNALESLQLSKYVQRTFDTVRSSAKEKGVELICEVSDEVYILGIKAYLESILLNFATNAIRYSNPDEKSFFSVKAVVHKRKVLLHLSDNGLGIDLQKHGDTLFKLHETFHDEVTDSRGLGLYLAKSQIESVGGTITVSSEPGKGTTFVITFQQGKSVSD